MKSTNFPAGWNEQRIRKVLAHYEAQTAEEAVAEDESPFEDRGEAVMEVPHELVPIVREIIAKREAQKNG